MLWNLGAWFGGAPRFAQLQLSFLAPLSLRKMAFESARWHRLLGFQQASAEHHGSAQLTACWRRRSRLCCHRQLGRYLQDLCFLVMPAVQVLHPFFLFAIGFFREALTIAAASMVSELQLWAKLAWFRMSPSKNWACPRTTSPAIQ
jgi:hypothetical protein